MRWLSFFILAYIALGLNSGLSKAIEFKNATPNFVLLAVVFISLRAPRDAALLGSFILGALQDFSGFGTLGLHAFSYGLVAVFIVALQQAIPRKHPLTHLVLTFFAGLVVAIILSMHGLLRPSTPGIHPPALPLFYSAVYSAILAPFLIGILQRISKVFHFQTSRGRM